MFIKREKKDDCIIAGFVVGDQREKEYNGTNYIEFGIGMGKDENGENLPVVNITVWDRQFPAIKKGDRVLAAGKLRVNEKDGKTYYSMSADFCIKEIMQGENIINECSTDDESLPF